MTRGFWGIGIYSPKKIENIGVLWRSAHVFGASFIFTIGSRYSRQPSDTTNASFHVPLYEYKTFEDFQLHCPKATSLVAIEQTPKARSLVHFVHPERCVYLLGAEDLGLPIQILDAAQSVVAIDTAFCLNVAVAGSIVVYDRVSKYKTSLCIQT